MLANCKQRWRPCAVGTPAEMLGREPRSAAPGTPHCLRSTGGLGAAAYGGQDANLAVAGKRCPQNLIPPNSFTINEDINVGTNVAPLSQHSILQPGVLVPQLLQRLTNSCRRTIDFNFRAPAGELR